MSFLKSLEKITSREISIEDFLEKTGLTYEEVFSQFNYDFSTPGSEEGKKDWRDLYRAKYHYYKDGVKIEQRKKRPLEDYDERLYSIINLRYLDFSRTLDLYIAKVIFNKQVHFGPYDTYDDIMTYTHMGYLEGEDKLYSAGESDLVPEYSKDLKYTEDLITALGYVDIHFYQGQFFVRNKQWDFKSSSLPRALAKLLFRTHRQK